MQPRLDRAVADPQMCGQFVIAPIFRVLQQQQHGILRVQTPHRSSDQPPPIVRQQHTPADRPSHPHPRPFASEPIPQPPLPPQSSPMQQRLSHGQPIQPRSHLLCGDIRVLLHGRKSDLLKDLVPRLRHPQTERQSRFATTAPCTANRADQSHPSLTPLGLRRQFPHDQDSCRSTRKSCANFGISLQPDGKQLAFRRSILVSKASVVDSRERCEFLFNCREGISPIFEAVVVDLKRNFGSEQLG